MSRIGRRPIVIPGGVDFMLEGNVVTVKGPKGTLSREVHPLMKVAVENAQPEVIAAAGHICGTSDKDGVVKWIFFRTRTAEKSEAAIFLT